MMKIDRRNFIKTSVASGAAIILNPEAAVSQSKISIPAGFNIKIMATNWGFEGNADQFCSKVKMAGYDGIEVVWPSDDVKRTELFESLKKYHLEYAFLIGSWDADPVVHRKNFEKYLRDAAVSKPAYLNCHAGKDYYTMEQNKEFIELTDKVIQEHHLPVYHETHRGRILYSGPVARTYLEKLPNLRVTLDISHWCAVHESLLADQSETVDMALRRTDHIHARIGHAEGPQVNDPRAPEWTSAVDAHWNWWDKVVSYKINSGSSSLTFLTEFGPTDYLPALPYTRQPVANQWDINVHMLNQIRKRYQK